MKKRIVSLMLALCMLTMLVPCVYAEIKTSGTCGKDGDNITWVFEDDTLTINGSGEMKDWNDSYYLPWHDLEYRIKSVVIENGITSIGDYAFSLYNLTNVEIPDSVTSIGNYAFDSCGLENIEIPDSVTTIGERAFSYCNFQNIEIPNSVTSIGDYAFYGSKIKNIKLSNKLTTLCMDMFLNCGSLENVDIPDSVNVIERGAFQNSAIQSVKLPPNLSKIDIHVFHGCSNLKSIEIPDSVTSIGAMAFYICDSLTDVYYEGSEEEWNKIDISSVDNDALLNATIHYNSIGTNPPEIVDTPTVTTSGNTYKFDIQLNNVQYSSSLITAVYKDGRMVNMSVTPLETGDTKKSVTVTADSADTAKVFIWGDLGRLTPLCESKTIDGQNFIVE